MALKGKFKKFAALGLIALLVLLGIWWYALRDEAPSYMTVFPETRDITKQVYATGTVEGKTQVDVGAQASGQILKLHVKTGDEVKKGDLLAEIDPRNQQNSLKSAQAELEIIKAKIVAKKAEIRKLQLEFNRQQNLLKTNATSKQDYEAAAASLDIAKAELTQYEAEQEKDELAVTNAETNLEYTQITAPMDGTVYATVVDEGQTVNAAQTTPTILRLADLSEITVKTEISEADVVGVKSGLECSFTILGQPHESFKGILGSIAPAPSSYESSSSTSSSSSSSSSDAIYYNADINVANPDRVLRIDMTADVTINIDSRQGVLAIPLTALRQDDGSKAEVYLLENGDKVIAREIKIGLRDEQFVEVLSGLDKNEKVVIGDDVQTAEAAAQQNDRRPKGMM